MFASGDDPRAALADQMNRYRLRLGLRWTHVATRAGMTEPNLRRIRNGEYAVTDWAAARIEKALRWEPGSIDAILAGGTPTELTEQTDDGERRDHSRERAAAPEPAAGRHRELPLEPPGLRNEFEREIWSMTVLIEDYRWFYIWRRRLLVEDDPAAPDWYDFYRVRLGGDEPAASEVREERTS